MNTNKRTGSEFGEVGILLVGAKSEDLDIENGVINNG